MSEDITLVPLLLGAAGFFGIIFLITLDFVQKESRKKLFDKIELKEQDATAKKLELSRLVVGELIFSPGRVKFIVENFSTENISVELQPFMDNTLKRIRKHQHEIVHGKTVIRGNQQKEIFCISFHPGDILYKRNITNEFVMGIHGAILHWFDLLTDLRNETRFVLNHTTMLPSYVEAPFPFPLFIPSEFKRDGKTLIVNAERQKEKWDAVGELLASDDFNTWFAIDKKDYEFPDVVKNCETVGDILFLSEGDIRGIKNYERAPRLIRNK